jgi:hypothetical protein
MSTNASTGGWSCVHLTDVPFYHAFQPPKDPSAKEKKYLDGIQKFGQTQGAYALIQGAQPQAPAAAFAMFPKDLSSPPREWAERFFMWSGGRRCRAGGTLRRSRSPSCS